MSRDHEEKRAVNIVLVGLSTDTGNLGVSALAEGTIEGLLETAAQIRMCVVDAGIGPSSLRVAAGGQAVNMVLDEIDRTEHLSGLHEEQPDGFVLGFRASSGRPLHVASWFLSAMAPRYRALLGVCSDRWVGAEYGLVRPVAPFLAEPPARPG